jgi:hypothetical protein
MAKLRPCKPGGKGNDGERAPEIAAAGGHNLLLIQPTDPSG